MLVTLALKTLLSISQNRMDQITLNKQLGNHLNQDIIMLPDPSLERSTLKVFPEAKHSSLFCINEKKCF